MNQPAPLLRCHILDTGACLAWEHHVIRGGARRRIECHALVALLRHPQHGWLLWDTGYAPRLLEATRHLPFSLYRRATPLRLRPELAVIAQLERFGLEPRDIRSVIHADHIAGLRDFPQAELIVHHAAYADVVQRQGLAALRRGLIPSLLPDDFKERVRFVSAFADSPLPALGAAHDLFGDGSLRLVPLPGHARGQMGLLAQTERGPLFFAADGCWLSRAVRERQPPHPLTYLFVDDPRAIFTTIERLSAFCTIWPDATLVPSHCPEAYIREVESCQGVQHPCH
jgi:glyoxylase-like metal-dependent hydrolase (beta-lactamase superfamily II)